MNSHHSFSMILIEIAERRGRINDPILKFPGAVLELEQAMDDLQGQIKKLTRIEMGDDGTPIVAGFSDEQKVAGLQQQLNEMRSQRDELLEIIARIEKIFGEHGRPASSMEAIDDRIKEIGQIGRDMQVRLNGLVIDLIVHNRAITLPEIWSHPDIKEPPPDADFRFLPSTAIDHTGWRSIFRAVSLRATCNFQRPQMRGLIRQDIFINMLPAHTS